MDNELNSLIERMLKRATFEQFRKLGARRVFFLKRRDGGIRCGILVYNFDGENMFSFCEGESVGGLEALHASFEFLCQDLFPGTLRLVYPGPDDPPDDPGAVYAFIPDRNSMRNERN